MKEMGWHLKALKLKLIGLKSTLTRRAHGITILFLFSDFQDLVLFIFRTKYICPFDHFEALFIYFLKLASSKDLFYRETLDVLGMRSLHTGRRWIGRPSKQHDQLFLEFI